MTIREPSAVADPSLYFQQLVDQIAVAITHLEAIRDANGQLLDFQIKFTNQAARRQPFAEPVGGRLLGDSPAQAPTFDHCARALATGQPVRYEQIDTAADGQRWLAVTVTPFGDGVLTTTQDSTARKQAELDSRRQAERLNFVTDSALTAIGLYSIIRDPITNEVVDLRYELINQMAARMLGRNAGDLIGHTMRETFTGIEQTGIWVHYKELAETGQPLRYQNHYTHDGYDLWYEVQGIRQGELIVLSFLNITELKQAQQHSQQQADLLQSVIDNSPSAIVLYEPIRAAGGELTDFRYKLVNPAAATVAGKSVADLLSSTLVTLYDQSNVSDLFDRLLTVQQTGDSQQFERYTELNGVELWANVTLVRQGANVLAVLEFVTRLKEAQRQLEHQNSALARSNESLQSFAFIASHDLQEPLRKIQSFSNLLRTQYAAVLDEQGDFLLTRMDAAAQRMSVLIRDLLALSRLTAQPQPFQPVDLDRVVTEVLTDLETVVLEKNALVTVDQLPTIQGDGIQLRQLVQNLLSNALKFTRTDLTVPPEPPRIQVACQPVPGNESSPTASPSGYRITVTDNGIGFDPAQAERIFGTFQRLHGRNQYEGTGIGLAIARKVVDNHGGTITAHSQPGQGATFTIYLPT